MRSAIHRETPSPTSLEAGPRFLDRTGCSKARARGLAGCGQAVRRAGIWPALKLLSHVDYFPHHFSCRTPCDCQFNSHCHQPHAGVQWAYSTCNARDRNLTMYVPASGILAGGPPTLYLCGRRGPRDADAGVTANILLSDRCTQCLGGGLQHSRASHRLPAALLVTRRHGAFRLEGTRSSASQDPLRLKPVSGCVGGGLVASRGRRGLVWRGWRPLKALSKPRWEGAWIAVACLAVAHALESGPRC